MTSSHSEGLFLTASEAYGMKTVDLFQTVDLFEAGDDADDVATAPLTAEGRRMLMRVLAGSGRHGGWVGGVCCSCAEEAVERVPIVSARAEWGWRSVL